MRRVVSKMEDKVQQRLVKFGGAAESKEEKLAKLKARKERFAAVSSSSLGNTSSNESR